MGAQNPALGSGRLGDKIEAEVISLQFSLYYRTLLKSIFKKICLLPEQLIMQQRLIRDGAVVKTVNQLFTHLISSPKFISFRVFMTVSSTNLHAYTSPHQTITERRKPEVGDCFLPSTHSSNFF